MSAIGPNSQIPIYHQANYNSSPILPYFCLIVDSIRKMYLKKKILSFLTPPMLSHINSCWPFIQTLE